MKNKTLLFLLLLIIYGVTGCDTYSRVGGDHLHLIKGNKELLWFNGIHNNDPNHRMFNDIDNEFLSFKPDLVLVEGGANYNQYRTRDEAILNGGEAAFTTFIARREEIKVENIEPSNLQVYDHLLRHYSKEDVLAMFLLRQVIQTQREAENRPINFERYYLGFINNMVEEGFPIEKVKDIEDISEILLPYINFKVTYSNWREIKARDIVYSKKGELYSVWREAVDVRDQHLVEVINEKLKSHDRIFVMMGFQHAINTRERIEKIFDNLN